MELQISIQLDREDWISLGKHLTAYVGKMVDIMPTVRLIDALTKNGIKTSELDPKEGKND